MRYGEVCIERPAGQNRRSCHWPNATVKGRHNVEYCPAASSRPDGAALHENLPPLRGAARRDSDGHCHKEPPAKSAKRAVPAVPTDVPGVGVQVSVRHFFFFSCFFDQLVF